MPRRAPIGNTDLIERSLPPVQKDALAATCAALEVPRRHWQRVDALNRLFTFLAVHELAEQLRTERGLSKRAALTEAAAAVGVPADTVLDWARRYRREARKIGVNYPPRQTSGGAVSLTCSQSAIPVRGTS